MLRSLLAIALFALVTIPSAHALGDSWSPAAATAASSSLGTLVAWTPGPVVADSYRVYGVVGDALTLLASTRDTSAMTQGAYAAYAVTGVKDGIEGPPTYAAASDIPCVLVMWDPPGYAIGWCDVGSLPVGVEGVPCVIVDWNPPGYAIGRCDAGSLPVGVESIPLGVPTQAKAWVSSGAGVGVS